MELPISPPPLVSVIGSRNATESGLSETRRIAKFLAKNNVTVVSGLARGIDTVAHATAMECKGRTIAVLETPIATLEKICNGFWIPENIRFTVNVDARVLQKV